MWEKILDSVNFFMSRACNLMIASNPRVSIIGWLESLTLIATYQLYLCLAKVHFGLNRYDSTTFIINA